MKNLDTWRGHLAVLLLTGLASGCALLPIPAPQHDEQAVGAPLPYEPPLAGVQVAPALPAVAPQVVKHGPRRKKRIALTFDACSTQGPSQFDERVIRTLIAMQVPATLFLGGKWMEEHPDETQELANHPHFELANHTYLHPHLPHESDARVREELARTQDMLYTLTGRRATLFRAPYGELDARVVSLGAEAGMIAIQYDLASGDPDPRISSKRLIEYVRDQSRNGSIVVMHMNGRGWKTAEALPRIVLGLRKKGYKLVTVSELLGRPPAPPVRTGPVLRD
ncbi:MAG TPA: polysaccharide deacetylase family protein [Acidiferrobacterales bacterium]|nr:polysaccharide deacetylase family protein [Acidiferrobacterales bacterium]